MIPKRGVKLPRREYRELIQRCRENSRNTCYICDRWFSDEQLAPHHVIPRGRLRLDVERNIVMMCFGCHRALHDGRLGVSVDDLIKRIWG